jgi:protein involved in polysaccharide export with SLBB domain
MNYILGPGDELQVSLNGVQEYNTGIPVSRRKSIYSICRTNLRFGYCGNAKNKSGDG